MDKFEFIAVLMSVVFGLALTNLLSGMLRAFFKRELTDTRLAWTILVGNLLLTNWWVFFRWSDNEVWHYYEYLYLVGWATIHYLMAVSLYPYDFIDQYSEELQRKFLLFSVMGAAVIDMGETLVRGELFEPWYYPALIISILTLASLPLLFPRPAVMRACGWILAIGMLGWSLIVRAVLVN
jgi:hypothetical protein